MFPVCHERRYYFEAWSTKSHSVLVKHAMAINTLVEQVSFVDASLATGAMIVCLAILAWRTRA